MSVLATDYPLLDVFWTTLWFVAFFLWIWLVIAVFADIFRSKDLSGWGKAAWILLVFCVPLLGVLIYLIARGKKMQQHAVAEAAQADIDTRDYIRQVVAQGDTTAGDLQKLNDLHDSGVLSDDDYQRMKAQLG